MAQGMGNILARLMLLFEQKPGELGYIDEIAATYAAYADALERVLGAPSGFLVRPDARAVREWLEVEEPATG